MQRVLLGLVLHDLVGEGGRRALTAVEVLSGPRISI